jgi:membrane protease YdiL (CAAX protease family)
MRIKRYVWNDEPRLRAPYRIALAVVGYAVLFFGVSVALGATGFPSSPVAGLVASGVVQIAVTAVLAWLLVTYVDKRTPAQYGLDPSVPEWGREFAVGLAVGALPIVVAVAVLFATGFASVEGVFVTYPNAEAPPADVSFWPALGAVAALLAGAALFEEVALRGYLLPNLEAGFRYVSERWAGTGAILVSSAVFGVAHAANPSASVVSVTSTVLAGVAFAAAYVWTGRLGLPYGAHLAWNGALVCFGLPVSGLQLPVAVVDVDTSAPALLAGGSYGIEAGLLGVLGFSLLFGLFRWYAGGSRELMEGVVPAE